MNRRERFLLLLALAPLGACGERSDLDVADAAPDVGGNGLANVSPDHVDFGLVDCGKFAPSQTVTVSNHGTAPFSFSAALGGGISSPYTISPMKDVVAPGGSVDIVIWPPTIPETSAVTTNLYGDTLWIKTTADQDTVHSIAITETARGATLSTGGPLHFGKTLVGTDPILPLTITNGGDIDATVAISVPSPFYATAQSAIVAAKSTTSVGIGYHPDATQLAVPANAIVTLTTGAVQCGTALDSVLVGGTPTETATVIGGAYWAFCALGQSGRLYCWGQGQDGALGNGKTQQSSKPVPAIATNVKSIAAAADAFCVALDSGAVQCWGAGLLGDGTTGKSSVPVSVSGLTDATRVIGGGVSSSDFCAIRETGQLVCWGYNSDGQFGAGYTNTYSPAVTPVLAFGGVTDVVAASIGSGEICIVRSGGGVQCAGSNYAGKLGIGNQWQTNSIYPVDVPGITSAVGISCTFTGACAVLSSGDVECWGDGYFGSLGNGVNEIAYSPVFVSGLHDAVALVGGYDFTCALRSTGEVACWGQGYHGELGNNGTSDSNLPVAVNGVSTATAIVAGEESACAQLANGAVLCWGDNGEGQLGNGTQGGYSTIPGPLVGFP